MLPPTLVAMTTRSLTPRDLSQCPIIASDSPPTFPGTQFEYMSAVSIKLYPASKRASSTENDSVWFAGQPKTLPPKHRGGTRSEERRVGKECVSMCRHRGTTSAHTKKSTTTRKPKHAT